MTKILLVGAGGFLGSILRYILSGVVNNLFSSAALPYGTLAVNMIGCFIIGFLNGFAESKQAFSPEIRLIVFMGFLGSFTTFSTFGYESFSLLRQGFPGALMGNVALHMIFGVSAVWAGYALSRAF